MFEPILRSAFLLSAAMTASITVAKATTSNSTTPTCTSPSGFANTIVPAPPSFRIDPDFLAAHILFTIPEPPSSIPELPATFSEATVATFCLEQCVAYQGNGTTGSCLSFNVNLGNPVPPRNPGPLQFFCGGFDARFADDGSDFEVVNVPGSYLYPLSVNRVCNGTFRAY